MGMNPTPVSAIELGTTRAVGVLGMPSAASPCGVSLLRAVSIKSSGVRKGEIVNVDNATATAKTVFDAIAKCHDVRFYNAACAVYSGGGLESAEISGSVPIGKDSKVVLDSDIAHATRLMGDAPCADATRRILEQIRTSYLLDGVRLVDNPIDMPASELAVFGLRTLADAKGAQAFKDALEYVGCGVPNIFSAAYCSHLGCASPEQRRLGALVINLGGGTTSWSVVKDGRVVAAASMPLGGDHVTMDLLRAFRTGSEETATILKHSHSSAILDGVPSSERIPLPTAFDRRTISLKAVSEVVNARMDEIFQLIRARLEDADLLHGLGCGVILCGGGASLKSVDLLAARVFGMTCRIGSPADAGFPNIPPSPTGAPAFDFTHEHCAALGALALAAKMQFEETRADDGSFSGKLRNIFRKK